MSQVRVRMYRPGGIGDCFLLSFGDGSGPHMLIDCGVLKGTPGGGDGLKKAIQNVIEVTHGTLDILVVTHEHWDHVSGFLQAEEEFKQLKIKEVWLAWTEERGNHMADHLRSQKEEAKKAVGKASKKLRGMIGANPQASRSLAALENLGLFYTDQDPAGLGASAAPAPGEPAEAGETSGDDSSGRHTTANAMDWARLRTGGKVKYLDPKKEAIPISCPEGARVFVLGPPENESRIKKENPSKRNPEVYSLAEGINLGFVAAMKTRGSKDEGRPFHASFERKMRQAAEDVFFQQTYFAQAEAWRKIDLDWLWTAQRLALQLDSDTNNTSLALAIELTSSGKVLIFPGDAQVGNWLSWEGLEWTARNARGEPEQVKVESLLKRTALYKVGHHASHNATTRWGLEQMAGEGFTALIPIYEDQARQQGKKDKKDEKDDPSKTGWEMPFPPLLARLVEKTDGRVFRADFGMPAGWAQKAPGKYEVEPGWVDVWVGEQ